MTKIASALGILVLTFLGLIFAGGAHAQATRTWVSGVGDDANPCSRTAPCKTFAGAISKTSASGEINVLDPGGFGALTITKAITISNDGVGTAGVLVAGTNGITIAAGASDVVTLRGLDIDGLGPTGGSLAGVQFNSGAALLIDHCKIYGFQAGGGAGAGIVFAPNSAAKLWITDTIVSSNGSSGGAFGSGNILIQPRSGGTVTAEITRVQALNGFDYGIRVDGSISGAGFATVVINNVIVDGGGNAGVVAATSSPPMTIMADTLTATNNVGYGVRAAGAGATILLTRSTVLGNGFGIGTLNGGVLDSYANNFINGNTMDGTPTTTLAPK